MYFLHVGGQPAYYAVVFPSRFSGNLNGFIDFGNDFGNVQFFFFTGQDNYSKK
jgi:hypothetical protein